MAERFAQGGSNIEMQEVRSIYPTGTLDGTLSPETQQAIDEWQVKVGVSDTLAEPPRRREAEESYDQVYVQGFGMVPASIAKELNKRYED